MNRTLLLVALILASDHTTTGAKFHVGQVVAVVMPSAEVQYFKIGYIDSELVDGEIKHYYTDVQRKIGGEWPEESLRAITAKECR